jgi:hypothetical protein
VSALQDTHASAGANRSVALPRPRRAEVLRLATLAALLPLAFAAPALIGLGPRPVGAPTEARLAQLMLHAYGGISLPVVGCVVAAFALGAGAPLRARLDRLIAAGLAPTRVAPRAIGLAVVVASVVPALVAALTVTLLRLAHHLGAGGVLLADAAGSAWAVFLGGAAWSALAALVVARSGRGARAYWLILAELGLRLLPGGAAWLSPSAHVGNLLGAMPPRSIIAAPVLPQWVSVLALAAVAVAGSLLAIRRYRAATPL